MQLDSEKCAFPVHLVGAGGMGMSALGLFLLDMGVILSGSDIRSSPALERLIERGARISLGHDAKNIEGARTVVVSDAVAAGNIEVAAALKSGVVVERRCDFLSRLCKERMAIQVTGTHGKTTTTSLIARVLEKSGRAPNYVMGAPSAGLVGGAARATDGTQIVIEAGEAFCCLSAYSPNIAVITNIDDDHLEHYGDQGKLDSAFVDFANCTGDLGRIIVNVDDEGIRRVLPRLHGNITTIGLEDNADLRAKIEQIDGNGIEFEVLLHGHSLGRLHSRVPAEHSVLNILAATAACLEIGVSFDEIAPALVGFQGPDRRWTDYGFTAGVRVIDDFAHHPSEVRASRSAAEQLRQPEGRLLVAFQPQVLQRIKRLAPSFAEALAEFDGIFLLEENVDGSTDGTSLIVEALKKRSMTAHVANSIEMLVAQASTVSQEGDVILVAGGGTIRRAARYLVEALTGDGTVHATTRRLAKLEIFTALDDSESPVYTGLLGRIACQAISAPASLALSCHGIELNHGALHRITGHLARGLATCGVSRGSVVALALPQSIDQICFQIATLKLGAAYLPLDSRLPANRISYMLETANVVLLVTTKDSPVDEMVFHPNKRYVKEIVALVEAGKWDQQTLLEPPLESDVATICFTSGTTGRPKGVPINHGALDALLDDVLKRIQFDRHSRMLQNASLNFDASIFEIFATLCAGSAVFMPESGRPLLGRELGAFIIRHRVTHLMATPSVLSTLPMPVPDSLRVVISVGEVCPQGLADNFSQVPEFFNGYGPAEATILSTIWRYEPNSPVCIGRPLAHIKLTLRDGEGQLVDDGEPGEICLGGPGICAGYLGGSASEAARFRQGENESGPFRYYRSGDLGRLREDGNIEFLGRIDSQVKIRGNRIELTEIEAALEEVELIDEAVVCVENIGTGMGIVAYYVAQSGSELTGSVIDAALEAWLAPYMIPSDFIAVAKIPLGITGKRDRLEASRRYRHRLGRKAPIQIPETPLARRLASLWSKVLELQEELGLNDDFTHLGGDSLKQMILILEIETEFGVKVAPGQFGRVTTVAAMVPSLELLLEATTVARLPDDDFESTDIYCQLREYTANWSGYRHDEKSLIVSIGSTEAPCHLFWCLQNGPELIALAKALGSDVCVHGMRSGHLVMEYTKQTVRALSERYLKELRTIYPEGTVYLGGNCQGGQISHAMAISLKQTGRVVSALILMEQARFPVYEDAVFFIFGESSFLNPLKRYDDGYAKYELAYPQGFTLDFIPGEHGTYFGQPNVQFLAAKISSYMKKANSFLIDKRNAKA